MDLRALRRKPARSVMLGMAAFAVGGVGTSLALHGQPATAAPAKGACASSADTGITLPPGFCATVFADNLGNTRHLAVAADGTVYANTWNGSSYFRGTTGNPAGFLVAVQDTLGRRRLRRTAHGLGELLVRHFTRLRGEAAHAVRAYRNRSG